MLNEHPLDLVRTSDRLRTSDGIELVLRRWRPERAIRASVLLVHGHGEHIGRYEHIASFLASSGLDVHGFDLRGHGVSGGPRVFVDHFGQYVEDTLQVAARVRNVTPERPWFIFGHSMGGLIALHVTLHPGSALCGAIVSSPFISPAMPIPRPLLTLAPIISRFLPWLPTLDVATRPLTHDPEMQRRKEADPLMYQGRVLARTGNEMRLAGEQILADAPRLELPLYIFHGTADHLADWKSSLDLYAKAGTMNKTLTLYTGMYHETMNEVRRGQVLDGVLAWVNEQLDPSQSRHETGS